MKEWPIPISIACTFLCRCFALDYRVKLPTLVTRFLEEFPIRFFLLPPIFTSVAASTSHLSHRRKEMFFSCFSSNEIRLLCFSSLVLALSLLSASVYTSKFSRKKDLALTAVNSSSYGWRIYLTGFCHFPCP